MENTPYNAGLRFYLRPAIRFLLFSIPVLLFSSRVLPQTKDFWLVLDQQIFFIVNGSLAEGYHWQLFWAWANTRYFDVLVVLIMGLFFILPDRTIFRAENKMTYFLAFIVLLLWLVFLRYLFSKALLYFNFSVLSPTLVLEPAYRLSELFGDIPLKDSSNKSFPGDHSMVVFIWMFLMLRFAHRWLSWVVIVLGVFFVLPRLISGAHWFSDIFVGGVSVALFTITFTMITSVLQTNTWWLQTRVNRIRQRFPSLLFEREN